MRFDQIDPGHAFSDGVFDLNARIDFDEIEFAGVCVLQELNGAGGAIADGTADFERRLAQSGALLLGQEGRGGAFDDLLVAALHGAIPLVEMHQVAVGIPEDLHLHMARAPDQLLEIDLILAKGRFGFAPGRRHGLDELPVVLDDAHASAAAAPARFEHHRKTDGVGHGADLHVIGRQGRRCRHHRHPRCRRQITRFDLVAEAAHGVGQRAHEYDAGGRTGLGKLGAFGQESVTWMNGIGPSLNGNTDDVVDVQIGINRALALAYQVALVGFGPMQRKAVFLRMNGNRANAEFGRGSHHTNGNFTAIRDEEALDGPRLGKWIHQ